MRQRRKIFIALGVILGAAILGPWLYHLKLQAASESYIKELTAQGEPMTLAQVRPPAIPDAENSAGIFLQAAALLEADQSFLRTNACSAMLPVGLGKAVAGSQQSEAVGYESTNSWTEVAAALAQNQAALELLRQITGHPALDFRINYQHGVGEGLDFTNLHLIELKKSGHYLAAAALSALHESDLTSAVGDQLTLLALVHAMQSQRFMISELVRMAMLSEAQKINWEIQQAPGVAEPQLASLQKSWECLNLIQAYQDALIMERITSEITLGQWRESSSKMRNYLEMEKKAREKMGDSTESISLLEKEQANAKTFLWQYWWSYPDELRSLQGGMVLLDTSRFLATNENFQTALKGQKTSLAALQITKIPNEIVGLTYSFVARADFHFIASKSIASLAGTATRLMTAETARRMTVTAIALQRYKLAHNHYPDILSGLVPEFLAAMPLDPVDGQPLRYRRNADGTFLLYSVGENGVDDGGDPAPANHGTPKTFYWLDSQALDWVWPQATTADNVQFIYTPSAVAK